MLSKDAVKEALTFVTPAAMHKVLWAIAMATVWLRARRTVGVAVVDSCWFPPRDLDFARSGLEVTGAHRHAEVSRDVPPAIAMRRYEERKRHPVHDDEHAMERDSADWSIHGKPPGLGPVMCVHIDAS